MMKFFSLERIEKAIKHLQNYDSNWILVPLVFAVNGVNLREDVSINKVNGGDQFLNKHFSGELIGLRAFENGVNTLRPRFSDIYGNMKRSGREDDLILHQNTKLWANVYSSRGYREMRQMGLVLGKYSRFKLTERFAETWEQKLPGDFHFEELLVWLYAFSGIDGTIVTWQELFDHFQFQYLGNSNKFENEYVLRFKLNDLSWSNDDFVSQRITNEDFQKYLYPSFLEVKERIVIEELNKIIYGPPGVGKSFSLKQETQEDGSVSFTTTFHPEYTYADFVGSFRPTTEYYGTEKQTITYRFRPEVFVNAYVEAWKNRHDNVFLIIEEINRGNSAAIFGDVFQLLDRDIEGYSEFSISCREELRQYLEIAFSGTDYAETLKSVYSIKFGKELDDPYSVLILPNNLVIRATMNTSDQSLFPMDSAFKRRWTWEYVPIRYNFTDRMIALNQKYYAWNEFIRKINDLIYEVLETEDKCIGGYFVKDKIISATDFRNKVIFYLWNDILRDETPETKLRIFPRKKTVDGKESDFPINFNDFFEEVYGWEYVESMLINLGLKPV